MGLDSYLERMPRYKNTTVNEISAIEGLFNLEKERESGSKYGSCTLKEWWGIDESELPSQEVIDYYRQFYKTKYYYWDDEKKYGTNSIIEHVGYWRKANQIHNWFVNNVQDGEDDCNYHNEVTKEKLEELHDTCIAVLESCVMINGKVKNGYTMEHGEWKANYEEGKVVIDSSVAEELLPVSTGFFFGSDEYDEYYVNDIVETIKIINEVLKETDFEKQAIYYRSSW